jgi:uncharacterized low-complexity protein
MRKDTLAAVISAVLLGSSVSAYAQEPSQPAESQAPATQSQTQTQAPDSAAGAAGEGQAPVGTPPSNSDEKSTSGDYYPYSAGTVGDDPAKPEATTMPTQPGVQGDDSNAVTTGDWMTADTNGDELLSRDEIEKAWPTVGARFDEIDVDGDKQASRDELRNWHKSQKARMDADQPAGAPASTAPAATVPQTQAPADVPPVAPAPANDEPTTADPATTNQ